MTAGDREFAAGELVARRAAAARIDAEHPGWRAGHDRYGWYACRLGDGHTVRAVSPAALHTLISVAPPPRTWRAIGELRRAYPGWHIWCDGPWCHPRRRGSFRQEYWPGAPLYAVHAGDPALLRERLEQQAGLAPPLIRDRAAARPGPGPQ